MMMREAFSRPVIPASQQARANAAAVKSNPVIVDNSAGLNRTPAMTVPPAGSSVVADDEVLQIVEPIVRRVPRSNAPIPAQSEESIYYTCCGIESSSQK